MDKFELLKKLLPGFLPLIVFIVVDSFLGTLWGIIFAIGFGLIELIFIYVKERRIDRFVIADTCLLVALGGISILLENDIFFKVKPAIIELIFCVLIGISVFSGKNIMLQMSQRYMKGIEMSQAVADQFNKSLKVLFLIFSFHVLLIVYSAFFMSTQAWGFISGVLFYILFTIYFLYEYITKRMKSKKLEQEEWFPLVDEKGNVTGKAPRSVCHSGSMLLHPVVHVHVLNYQGNIFLQKRSMNKDTQPGKWDTAVGGHIAFGEDLETALNREIEEEIGLKNIKCYFLTSYVHESKIERELVYLFYTLDHQGIVINKEEIDEGKFWTMEEIKNARGKGILTPNLESELEKYGKLILSRIK
jgi:isopentenyldiphosphate isomerase/intracellular septation protein A